MSTDENDMKEFYEQTATLRAWTKGEAVDSEELERELRYWFEYWEQT